ncbi:longitudinals lacking protein, isoforms H/M/V isoform X7 [Drosophila ficusphila]|uniref:longitudinals lacking protein, isoforms H/M/V isoform X7 n=1 Tax=Drosophila ficusphila TaxID=30025 RepID=UPI0007E69BA4|nr:longitudinals lacking protein, isoforms H/M/V isoform X7 [Drosophila ficusphila]
MDDDQQFCLRWNNHQSTLISVFDTLLENETLVDCTLAAEGKFLKAHKVVLSACSPYFATLLQEQYDKHPIFILKDVKYQELRAMMDYMYRGEVNISQDQLAALLKAAESLQIKGLSDNRTGGGSAPKPESSGPQHHRGGKLSGAYTLEQTKRARLATSGALDTSGDVSGSREGSSSPSRRRRKVRRRSMENDAHDNSNSSVLQAAASNQSILQQTGAGLAVSALVSTQLASGPAAGTSSQASSTQQQQPLTSTNVTKKTESAKLTSSTAAPASGASASAAAVQQAHLQQAQTTSDAINTENVQAQSQGGAQGVQGDDEDMDEGSAVGGASAASGPNPASASASAVHAGVVVKQLASVVDKSSSNHKQKIKDNSVSSVGSEMVIEPKAEYDDDAHDENVEDLTLDEEDMTMEELDQTAGTSQGGEGSSQTYATWQQHDRSQDELGLMAQDAQQRDPQGLQLIDDSSSSQQNHLNGGSKHLELMDGSSDDYHQGSGSSLHHFHAPQFDHFHGLLAGGNGSGGGGGGLVGGGGQEESFTCPQCYRTYRRHGTLRRHLRQECGKGKSMVCSVCGHRTKRADHLRQHVRKKHPEIAMRSLFKRQQRAAAAAASSADGEEHSAEPEIVDLVDMLDDSAGAAGDEDNQHAYLVEDDDEDELPPQQSSHLMDESTTSSYYRQQLRQQALLQQALQHVAAAVVASGSSSSSAEMLKGEGL